MNTKTSIKSKKSLSPIKRVTGTLAIGLLAIASLTSCSMANGGSEPLVTNSVDDSESVLKALDSAVKITAKKAVLAFGDRWTVSADGVEVGEVRGQAIYLIGDTYSLFSNAGNLVGSEAEGYRVIHNRAETYDYNNQPRGEIKQTFSMFLSKYEIKDTDDVVCSTFTPQKRLLETWVSRSFSLLAPSRHLS